MCQIKTSAKQQVQVQVLKKYKWLIRWKVKQVYTKCLYRINSNYRRLTKSD